jgi:hypothetical protein
LPRLERRQPHSGAHIDHVHGLTKPYAAEHVRQARATLEGTGNRGRYRRGPPRRRGVLLALNNGSKDAPEAGDSGKEQVVIDVFADSAGSK